MTHTPKYTHECVPQPHHHPPLPFNIFAVIHDSKKKSYLLLTSKDDDAVFVCVCVCTAPATTVALCTLCLLLSNI